MHLDECLLDMGQASHIEAARRGISGAISFYSAPPAVTGRKEEGHTVLRGVWAMPRNSSNQFPPRGKAAIMAQRVAPGSPVKSFSMHWQIRLGYLLLRSTGKLAVRGSCGLVVRPSTSLLTSHSFN